MLTLTSPIDTPLHRLPAGAKMAALCLATLALFSLSAVLSLTVALLGVAALYLTGGPRFAAQGLRMLRPLWPFIAVVALWHLWSGDPVGGTEVILRMVAAVAAANLVTLTSRLTDMLAVMERLFTPLARLGLPPRTLALAVALVIRFVPVLIERQTRIAEAWRARAPRRPGWRILLPATLGALDDADRVAEALRARGGIG
jgi:biotin transport system permease protein